MERTERLRQQREAQRRLRNSRRVRGECIYCGKPRLKHRTMCERHRQLNADGCRAHRRRAQARRHDLLFSSENGS